MKSKVNPSSAYKPIFNPYYEPSVPPAFALASNVEFVLDSGFGLDPNARIPIANSNPKSRSKPESESKAGPRLESKAERRSGLQPIRAYTNVTLSITTPTIHFADKTFVKSPQRALRRPPRACTSIETYKLLQRKANMCQRTDKSRVRRPNKHRVRPLTWVTARVVAQRVADKAERWRDRRTHARRAVTMNRYSADLPHARGISAEEDTDLLAGCSGLLAGDGNSAQKKRSGTRVLEFWLRNNLRSKVRLCAAAVSLLLGRSSQWSEKEIDASQAERLGRSCLSIACFALSLSRSFQAERDNES
ncbi:hypothetical protein EVAR_46888_1 [Eumeta japonica]|uniref:Uncharacterized protein n=1 Tax=Eumeta variegata TaxID=151549 RepID=A0A4C1YCK7_EUMVA|nr:hypothetical protein EVAR_46888_1 [Eumeta japonica]